MTGMLLLVITSLFGYLLGSINISLMIAKKRGVNLLTEGTHNPGTVNAIHTMGVPAGAIVLAFDVAKAIVPYFVARVLNPTIIWAAPLAAALAVFGHVFPCWNKFKGGKGLASVAGFMIVTAPAWVTIAIIAGAIAISFITNGARWVIPGACVTFIGFTPFIFADVISMLIAVAAVTLVIVKNVPVVKGISAGSELTFHDVFSNKSH